MVAALGNETISGDGHVDFEIEGTPGSTGAGAIAIEFLGETYTFNFTSELNAEFVLDTANVDISNLTYSDSEFSGQVSVPYTGGNGGVFYEDRYLDGSFFSPVIPFAYFTPIAGKDNPVANGSGTLVFECTFNSGFWSGENHADPRDFTIEFELNGVDNHINFTAPLQN